MHVCVRLRLLVCAFVRANVCISVLHCVALCAPVHGCERPHCARYVLAYVRACLHAYVRAGDVSKTCSCWADLLPAYAALKAAADSDPAVAAQFASIAGMDSQIPGVCASPKAAAFVSCVSAPKGDGPVNCTCWTDFAPTYATLSASKDKADVNVLTSLAPMVPSIQAMCGKPKVAAFMSCISPAPAGNADGGNRDAQGCKCWSDFAPTWATITASTDRADVIVVALLKDQVPIIQKTCANGSGSASPTASSDSGSASALAATKTTSNGFIVSPGFSLVAPAVLCIAIFTALFPAD